MTCHTAKKSKLLARAAIVHALLEFLNLKINVEDDWKESLGDVEGCKGRDQLKKNVFFRALPE